MTANNFHVNNNTKVPKKRDKKNETQVHFYNDKGNSSNSRNFSSVYPNNEINYKSKQSSSIKKKYTTQESLPDVNSQEINDPMSASTGFSFMKSDLKKGITLDKVFGGGFKKIAIFDAGLSEFKDNIITEDRVKKKTTRLSTSIDEEEFKQFDIVETENEEDCNLDSREDLQYKSKAKEPELEERPSINENTQIMDKIQMKYKPKKTKMIYRRKSKIIPKNEFSTEKGDIESNEHDVQNEEILTCDMDKGRESALGRNESKSMSPKMANEMKKNRFQSLVPDKQKFIASNTKYGMPNEIFYGLKRVPYDMQNDSKSQTQNRFRISTNKFKSTKENLKTESDDSRSSYTKKPLQIKALLNDFNYANEFTKERRTEQDAERSTSRSSSIVNTEKIMENIKRMHGEKLGKHHIEQKLSRENRMITEKIKKAEQDIMQKYSKMFHFNNEESKLFFPLFGLIFVLEIYLLKNKADEGGRRLSTPMKDIDSAKYFSKRFINHKELV